MANISFVNLGATATPDMNTNSAATSFTNSSSTPPKGLVLLFIHSDRSSGDVSDPTVTGTNGWNLTWTKIVGINGVGTSQGQYLYAAIANGGVAGTITVDYGGNSQAGFATSMFYATGVDLSGGVAGAFVQTVTSTPTSTATPSITLAAAGATNNRPFAYFYNNAGVAVTPRTNWTEMDDWGGNTRAPETQVRVDAFETTASCTAASGTPNWFIIAGELKASATVAPSNVMFWHDLKEGTGTAIHDQNEGADATMSASPTWTTSGPTGISVPCVNFALGTDQKRIDTAASSRNQVAFCLTAWFKNAGGNANIRHMIAGDSTTGGTHVPTMYLDTSDHINARIANPGVGDDFVITGSTDYGDGNWHLAIFQRDAAGNAELFVDGVSQGTATNTTAISAKTFNIGNALDADGSTDFNWAGQLSQCVLFDSPLSSTERASLYNSGAGTKYGTFFSVLNFSPHPLPKIADATDTSSYTGTSWTPPNELILAFVSTCRTVSTPPNTPTLSGNGLTWTQIATALVGTTSNTRITLFAANGSGASAGAVTVDFAGQTVRDCQAFFLSAAYSDVANGVAQSVVQSPTNNGSSVTTLSITLSAAGNSANRPIAGFISSGGGPATPRTNWTEYNDLTTDTELLETQYRWDAFETTASFSGAPSGNVAGIAAEIKAKVVSAVNSGFFLIMGF